MCPPWPRGPPRSPGRPIIPPPGRPDPRARRSLIPAPRPGTRRRLAGRRARRPGRPAARSAPPAITSTGRQSSITTSRLCSMTRMVTPCRFSAPMRSTRVSRSAGLTPAAGSSRSRRRGSVMRARPSSSSFRWPPDRTRAGSRLVRAQTEEVQERARPLAMAALLRGDGGRARPVRPEALSQLAPGREHDVLQHRHRRKGPGHLKRARDAAREHPVRRLAVEPAPVEEDPPGARRERAGHEVEERALPGAVRPDQAR